MGLFAKPAVQKQRQDGAKIADLEYPLGHSGFGPLCCAASVEAHPHAQHCFWTARKRSGRSFNIRHYMEVRRDCVAIFVNAHKSNPESTGCCAVCDLMMFETVAQIFVCFEALGR